MANRQVKIRQGKIDDLIKIYENAYKDIVKTIVSATEAGKIQKAKTMASIKAQLTQMGVDVDKWVQSEIPQYYLDGANQAVSDLKKLGVDLSGPKGLAPINKQAIASLTDDTALAFAQGMTGIARNASMILGDAYKQQLNFIIADGSLKGEALKTVTASVKQAIQDNGLTALTDSAGRNWSFDRYAEMLVRTKGVEARNAGMTDKMLQNGYDLVQVSNHGSDHPACAEWEGAILSITGNTDGYPTTDEAEGDGLMHPNCEHAYNPIDPDIADLTNMYDNPFNYDEADAMEEDFAGPGAAGVKTQNIKVYHGSEAIPVGSGTDLFGSAYYVARDKATAQEFGKVTQQTLSIKASEILTIGSDAELNKLVSQAIKAYPGEDINVAIPKFARSQGYKAIEATEDFDPLGGLAIIDKNAIK